MDYEGVVRDSESSIPLDGALDPSRAGGPAPDFAGMLDASDPEGMGGKPKVDRQNPKEELRSRPIVGLRVVEGFEYSGGGEWKHGRIYDPESGKTYKCKMRLTDEGVLKVRGFIGFSLLGRTTEWTRVNAQ